MDNDNSNQALNLQTTPNASSGLNDSAKGYNKSNISVLCSTSTSHYSIIC